MKTKKGFKLRTICGENVIVAEGIENIDFSKIISMNESRSMWRNYEVDEATARQDVATMLQQWTEAGMLE